MKVMTRNAHVNVEADVLAVKKARLRIRFPMSKIMTMRERKEPNPNRDEVERAMTKLASCRPGPTLWKSS